MDYSHRLKADAAGAMKERKYAKAEHYLRQLLNITVVMGGGVHSHTQKGATTGGSKAAKVGWAEAGAGGGGGGGDGGGGGGGGGLEATEAEEFAAMERAAEEEVAREEGRGIERGGGEGEGGGGADESAEAADPLAAAPVLYRLSQAVGKQRRHAEEEALLRRALRAVEAVRGPDGRVVTPGCRIRYMEHTGWLVNWTVF